MGGKKGPRAHYNYFFAFQKGDMHASTRACGRGSARPHLGQFGLAVELPPEVRGLCEAAHVDLHIGVTFFPPHDRINHPATQQVL